MKKFTTSLACLILLGGIANAQEILNKELDGNGQPNLITFKKGTGSNAKSAVDNNNGTAIFKKFLKINDQTTFKSLKTQSVNNLVDQKYQQYYQGVKVEFSTYSIHLKDGELTSINGSYLPIENFNVTPGISEKQALDAAKRSSKGTKFVWDLPNHLGKKYNEPIGELVVLPFDLNGKKMPILAYKFDIYTVEPNLTRATIYINAMNGAFIYKNDIIKNLQLNQNQQSFLKSTTDNTSLKTLDVGNADTYYSGKKTITTSKDKDGKYVLKDTTRGGGIFTFNANSLGNGQTGQLSDYITEFTDNDNNWTADEHKNDMRRLDNRVALDVHWAAEQIYDYWKTVHNRNSYDDKGAVINSYVHFSDKYDNAAWTGEYMIYGDGDILKPFVSLDIAAHEIGHAVATSSSDLQYMNENGAINEALSDIWGAVIENHVSPTGKKWEIGEEISPDGIGIRSLSNPKVVSMVTSPQPDTYLGINWYKGSEDNGGVHINSGVINHFFYILSDGKKGKNDVGSSFDIKGIGIEKAAKIVYRAESVYLTAEPTFADFRNMLIQAATDLYGENAVETTTVANAMYAVNIGLPVDAQNPTAPIDVKVTKQRSTNIRLAWTKATDNFTVKGYKVYQEGKEIADTDKITIDVFDLKPGTTYKFTVKAYDQNNNLSESSNEVSATTAATSTDTVKPSTPVITLGKTGNDYVDITWKASTDNDELRGYVIFVDGVKLMTVGKVTSARVKPVTINSKHIIYIQAYDFENNYSEESNKVTTTTFTGEYCKPVGFGVNAFRLNQFTLSNVNYPLDDEKFVSAQDAYPADYTLGTPIELKAGETYKGTFGFSPMFQDVAAIPFVWIDYNRDNMFNPDIETAFTLDKPISEIKVYDFTIKVPDNVKLEAQTRLRVGFVHNFEMNESVPNTYNLPCGSFLSLNGFSDFSVTITEKLGISETLKSTNIKAYPNPFSNQLTVESASRLKQVELYNIAGLKVVAKEVNETKAIINLGNIPAGVYILKTINEKGEVETQKLIKK